MFEKETSDPNSPQYKRPNPYATGDLSQGIVPTGGQGTPDQRQYAPPPQDVGAEALARESMGLRDRFINALDTQSQRPGTPVNPVQAGVSAAPAAAQSAGPGNLLAQVASVAPVQHTTVGPAAGYQAANVAATQGVDAFGGFRGGQEEAVNLLRNAATGAAPSAAEEAIRRQSAANIAQQMALRASARGTGVARAERAASDATAQIGAQMTSQLAQTRAAEQAQAREGLVTALSSARGQDLSGQGTNAQLDAAKALEQARLQQQAASEGAAAKNTLVGKQADVTSGEGIEGARLGTDVSKFTAQQGNEMALAQQKLALENNQFNAGQTNDVGKFGAQMQQQGYQFNAQQMNDIYKANQNNQIDWAKLDDATKQAYIDAILKAQGLANQDAATHAGYYASTHLNDKDWLAAGTGALGGGLGILLGK